tara:strand:- start:2357 stop:2611 length:255 start_codon:yes stop_codon:yes gene_type:complete
MAVDNNPHKPFGADLDPNNELTHNVLPDGDVEVTYKGGKMKYMTYIDEMEDRATRKSKGKSPIKSHLGFFGGFGKGKLNKNNHT